MWERFGKSIQIGEMLSTGEPMEASGGEGTCLGCAVISTYVTWLQSSVCVSLLQKGEGGREEPFGVVHTLSTTPTPGHVVFLHTAVPKLGGLVFLLSLRKKE